MFITLVIPGNNLIKKPNIFQPDVSRSLKTIQGTLLVTNPLHANSTPCKMLLFVNLQLYITLLYQVFSLKHGLNLVLLPKKTPLNYAGRVVFASGTQGAAKGSSGQSRRFQLTPSSRLVMRRDSSQGQLSGSRGSIVSERGHNCPNSPPPRAGPPLKSETRFPETLLPPLAPTVPIHTQTDF